MTTIHMKNAALYLGTTNALLITEATEVTLDVEVPTVDDSAFGDTWESRLKGAPHWKGGFSGNFDTASTNLFDVATSTTIAKMYVYADRSDTTKYYYGSCWPDLKIAMARKDAGRVSGNLDGSGQLAQN